ncbi:MAG: peptidoglycan-binding protein LysM [Saprospiraceae bacterium]
MGLFSFLKNAGAKIFKSSKKEEVQKVEKEVTLSKIEALRQEVTRLNLPINGMSLDLGEQIIVEGSTNTNAEREKVILALGNINGVSSVDDRITVMNPEPEATFYTVQRGDSLSKISKAQYGDPMKYQGIFEANQPMLSHPDKIYPGQVLRIPTL